MPRYYEFEVAPREIQPRIWRRLLLRTTASFAQLHQSIQDFGDGWTHDVKRVAVHSDKERFKRRLLEGERAAPPEDCGGTPGDARRVHYLETGEDLYDEDPDELGAWLDGWRPNRAKEGFDR